MASAPLFTKIVFLEKFPGTREFSFSASSIYFPYGATLKQVCTNASSCSRIASKTLGARWPTFTTPMPPAKSRNLFPSTSSSTLPSARAAKIVVACPTPRGTAACLRRNHSCDRGPGIGVRNCMVGISVPSDRLFIQIDVHLFGLQIFFDAPGPQLSPKPRLLVPAPRSFDVGRLHVIHPNDAGAESLHHSKGLKNVARPHGRGQTVWRGICNPQRFGFICKRDDCGHRTKDLFLRDARGIIHIVKDCGLNIVAP